VQSLKTAFHDVERLLIISTNGDNDSRIRQHLNAVKAAKESGVKFIAYTSVANARKSELFLAVVHRTTEEAIEASGIPYAFLRNNWYLGNERSTIAAVMGGAPWITSAGDGKVGWATREEYAEAAANVLLDDSIRNKVFELSGKPLTQAELAAQVGELLGRKVEVKQVNDQEYVEIMKAAGVPDFMLPMVLSIQQGIRQGTLDIQSNDFERVLKRPLKPLSEALKAII
jgi:NAD(P)H dehydrogenase (quinone)